MDALGVGEEYRVSDLSFFLLQIYARSVMAGKA